MPARFSLGTGRCFLPGGTHAGKSALVAELLRCGAVYLSDEYALIDDRGRAQAYPRPLLLRNGGAEQVPRLPEEFHAAVATLRYRSAGFSLSNTTPRQTGDWPRRRKSEALLALLRNTPMCWPKRRGYCRPHTRLGRLQVLRRQTRRCADAAGHILRLVAE